MRAVPIRSIPAMKKLFSLLSVTSGWHLDLRNQRSMQSSETRCTCTFLPCLLPGYTLYFVPRASHGTAALPRKIAILIAI
eukprot:6018926-Prymnesium_polylepis.1